MIREHTVANKERTKTRRFIVTCHGWSASNWLAYALNSHEAISCAHSSAAILADDPSIFDGDGLKKSIPALRKGYIQRQNRPISEVYDAIESARPARYIGTVHTYRLRDLPVQSSRFGNPQNAFPVVNLVRHPFDLVVSGYGQFRDLFPIDLNEFAWTLRKVVDQGLEIVEDVCNKHGRRPGDFEEVCFFGACVVLGSLRADLDALESIRSAEPGGPWNYRGAVKMEEVTQSGKTLADLIERLTGEPGLATAEYLERVASFDRINRHNRSAPRGRLERWNDLEEWQRDGFKRFLDHFDLRRPYSELGYEFAFMEG